MNDAQSQKLSFVTDSDISLLLDIANCACHKGYVNEARSVLDGILAVKPGFSPAIISQAFTYIVVDDFEPARTKLEELLSSNPEDQEARLMLGLALSLSGEANEAEKVLAVFPAGTPQRQLADEFIRL